MRGDESILSGRTIDWSPGRLATSDPIAAFFADNPEAFSLAVDALVCLSPSTIPRIDIF